MKAQDRFLPSFWTRASPPEHSLSLCHQTERKDEAMSHDAAVPKGPAPEAEGIPVRKPMKYLETLLTTETEEVFNADETSRHVTTVRRSVRR